MTNDQETDDAAHADLVADMMSHAVGQLVQRGWPLDVVLAGVHAFVISEMATTFGRGATAKICTMAAAQVQAMPSLADVTLAAAPPAGRA